MVDIIGPVVMALLNVLNAINLVTDFLSVEAKSLVVVVTVVLCQAVIVVGHSELSVSLAMNPVTNHRIAQPKRTMIVVILTVDLRIVRKLVCVRTVHTIPTGFL